MDGGKKMKLEIEKPIAKPSFPLPMVFSLGKYAEMPTRRRSAKKAHFYRKQTTESGTPIYDFVISDESEH